MDTLAVILIVVAVVAAALAVGGYLATRKRSAADVDYSRHVAAADQALQRARAADKGWDRPALEAAAASALRDHRPGFSFDELHLVLVDDRPGITEDRAHFAAVGEDGQARVVLVRGADGWAPERVE
jgi:hypothetical protein